MDGPHLLSVVGARPQFIKCASVVRALDAARPKGAVRHTLVHTGQHYDAAMSDVFFDELKLPVPDHHLGVGSGSHGAQTGEMLMRLDPVLAQERPDLVVVYGDTNSTLAGALAASKLGISMAHVEAGLRSFNRRMPEEINRVLTDHLSSLLFCPTALAAQHLAAEGIREGVHVVGDVMYDLFLQHVGQAQTASDVVLRHGVEPGRYALATLHRAEATDEPARLGKLLRALAAVGQQLPVILPLHPRTRKALAADGASVDGGVRITEPVPYGAMLALEAHARVILTDSGGVQKEAYWMGVPCVTLRRETEWPETVQSGWNALAADDSARTVELAMRTPPAERDPHLYGDGAAASRVVDHLLQFATREAG